MELNTEYMWPRTKKIAESHKKIFLNSQNVKNTDKTLSNFFVNSSMAKLLDIFLENPNTPIYTVDLLNKTGLSRKAVVVYIPILLENNIIIEEQIQICKFFKLNKNNSLVKQISKLRNSIQYGDRKQQETEKN